MARRKKQNEDQSEENLDNNNMSNDSDDTFGLPEVEYQPLNRQEQVTEPEPEQPTYQQSSYETREEEASSQSHHENDNVDDANFEEKTQYKSSYSYMEEDKPELWPKILGFALVFIVAAVIVWFFAFYQPAQKRKAEEARIAEQHRIDAAEKKRRQEEQLAELRRQEEQRRADSLANLSKVGSLETLTERTGRYYVVVASAIDDDLLSDFGNKLVQKGVSCKIIPPYGKSKFSRLAIDAKDTYEDAQSTADGLKGGEYGDKVWVVKY